MYSAPTRAQSPAPPPLYNGAEESGFDAVVALGMPWGDEAISVCSGTIITTRLILTAAHCGDQLPTETVVAFGRAFVGPEASSAEHVLEFTDQVIHPDYEELDASWMGDLGQYDFSVIELLEDAPVAPMPLRWDPFEEDEVLGTTVLSVGYGITSPSQDDSGIKRSAWLTVDELDEMFLISESNTNPDGANVCSGDSGGPQLFEREDGSWEQWAVHSWGDSNCRSQSGSTRVDLIGDWLLERIEEVHGTTDECAYMGWYGDGTCDEDCLETDPDCETAATEETDETEKRACTCAGSDPTSVGLKGWGWLLALPVLVLGRRRP